MHLQSEGSKSVKCPRHYVVLHSLITYQKYIRFAAYISVKLMSGVARIERKMVKCRLLSPIRGNVESIFPK